ncbi:hypothetical protein F4801DRAFT_551605 [Xylaria longipes]|nr:hypothetical protein F4801DRAFT_551605 [Xylaria longipes]
MANPAEKVITICLMSLSNQHAIRYYDEGRMVHLESSIDLLFQVAVLVPGINTDPHYLFHIAFRMGAEFQLTGAMTALDTSILMAQRAVELAPPNAPDRALYCHTLGRALGTRGIKANIPSDIDDAITASREAVNRTAEGHIDRKTYIYGLEAWLGDRYSRCGDMADLQEIIKLGIEIVSSMSDEDPHKALRANNLGFRIQQRYAMQVAEAERRQQRHLVPLDDLDGAIKCYYYAAVHTPEDNVLRRAYGSNVLNAVRQYCQGMDSILDHQNNNRRPSEPPTTEDTSQTLTPASGTTAVAPDADELGLGRGVLSSSLEEPRTDGHPFNTPVSSDGAPELSEQPSVLETT